MRLFFAVPLPERVQDELARFQSQGKHAGVAASWPHPGGLHLTLAFLGEQDASVVPALRNVAIQSVANQPAFRLKTSHLGGFPKARVARVLWLGLEEAPGLRALAEDLRRGLKAEGMAFDDKPFQAHLTLARFKVPQDVATCGEPPAPMIFDVREVVLFRSVQAPSGARYESLGSAPLGKGPG